MPKLSLAILFLVLLVFLGSCLSSLREGYIIEKHYKPAYPVFLMRWPARWYITLELCSNTKCSQMDVTVDRDEYNQLSVGDWYSRGR